MGHWYIRAVGICVVAVISYRVVAAYNTAESLTAYDLYNKQGEFIMKSSQPVTHTIYTALVLGVMLPAGLVLLNGCAKTNLELHAAAQRGETLTVERLLDKNVDVNGRDADGQTALHKAAARGHKNVVMKLLEYDADPNARDADGRTPLHVAAMQGHLGTVNLLLVHDADEDIRDNFGDSPLDLAAEAGHDDVVKILRAHKM